MAVELGEHQKEALKKMHNGCILCGDTGSGKTRTALAYYFFIQGGRLKPNYIAMKDPPKDLYIITTAQTRDKMGWQKEMVPFLMMDVNGENLYSNKIIVDSWNNIGHYKEVENAFFIFDEQRVVGKGEWVKSFLKITQHNEWILLSATPGDKWEDYIPVFIANGFYKNRTEFLEQHAIYKRQFGNIWKIDSYVNTKRLERLRERILVEMPVERSTIQHHEDIVCSYDIRKYKDALKNRWNPFKEEPIEQASTLCYILRRIVNEDPSRMNTVLDILHYHPKAIIFYNFDYERDALLRTLSGTIYDVAEWNGHKHQPIPETDKWVYLVQYTAGCEGWNCITTDTIIFYSQSYSYKQTHQAVGRIDRLNTPFIDLNYYHLKSKSPIDIAISRALEAKKEFNETKFAKGYFETKK